MDAKTQIDLSGVPETMLWPLWNRASESQRHERLLADPMAADLVSRIDYDFAGHFGSPHVFHAIRARVCDDLIGDYLARTKGNSTVIALGEGLETQLWRVDDNSVNWVSVDLPEAIDTRRRLLPDHPRARLIAASALDADWMQSLPASTAPFVSAAGLFMYFHEQEVETLLTGLAQRFSGVEVFFDTIPPHFSRKTLKGAKITPLYTAPPMPWGIRFDDIAKFIARIPGFEIRSVRTYAQPFPQRTRFYNLLSHIGPVRNLLAPGLVHISSMTS